MLFLLLAGCAGEKAKLHGGAAPIEEFKTKFPRTFSGSAEYRVPGKTNVLDKAAYARGRADSVLGCLQTEDFTLVMRNGEEDQMRIRVRGLAPAPGQATYRNLTDVQFDGYSPSQRFTFDSANDGSQLGACTATLNRVDDELVESDLYCVNLKSNKDGARADFTLHFTCDLVRP